MKTSYQTDRLILKILDSSYKEAVCDYYLENKGFLKEWEIERKDIFYTCNFQGIQLDRDYREIRQGKMLSFWIFKKESQGQVIGNISFTDIKRGPFLSCNLGYKLNLKDQGRGYMTEALEKGIEIIFDEHRLHRIQSSIMPRNFASLRLVEKLDFVNEGLAKKYIKVNGKWEDHVQMVLLNDKMD